jgi:tetratricopeptide (TPR) repeat protein
VVAAAVVALAAAVALASPARAPAPAGDPIAESLSLASSLEEQERFAEAANIYRDVAERQPDRDVRLRLAYCLLRSNQPAEAATTAGGVVNEEPENPEALLLLGLAQRAQGLAVDSTATLQRFLALDPDHEAASQVRRLLEPEPP